MNQDVVSEGNLENSMETMLDSDINDITKDEDILDSGLEDSQISNDQDNTEGFDCTDKSVSGLNGEGDETLVDTCSLENTTYASLRNMVIEIPEFYGGSYIDEEGKLIYKGQLHVTLEGLKSILPETKESVMKVNDTKTLT